MKRDNLKSLVRVLLSFVISNVAPRLGDKMAVRTWELPVLYAIMTGQLHLSFRQLVMMHVWHIRNTKNKKPIPHVWFISALLEKQGALLPTEYSYSKPHTVFAIADMCKSEKLKYVKKKKWYKIKYGTLQR
ncbi:hypothetical protein Hanom_Chr02g00133701 [Helianthus anomalus]